MLGWLESNDLRGAGHFPEEKENIKRFFSISGKIIYPASFGWENAMKRGSGETFTSS
jgi:hypothetical protein